MILFEELSKDINDVNRPLYVRSVNDDGDFKLTIEICHAKRIEKSGGITFVFDEKADYFEITFNAYTNYNVSNESNLDSTRLQNYEIGYKLNVFEESTYLNHMKSFFVLFDEVKHYSIISSAICIDVISPYSPEIKFISQQNK